MILANAVVFVVVLVVVARRIKPFLHEKKQQKKQRFEINSLEQRPPDEGTQALRARENFVFVYVELENIIVYD